MNKVMNPVFDIIDSLNQMQSVKGIEEELLFYLNSKTDTNMVEENKERRLKEICFKGVSFSFEPGLKVISDLSFCFDQGKKYAIVGESGSGKTTLLKLIEGELNGYEGTVYYNDESEKWKWQELKRVFSVINQEIYLFEGTIKENILFDKILDDKSLDKIVNDVKLKETLQKKR